MTECRYKTQAVSIFLKLESLEENKIFARTILASYGRCVRTAVGQLFLDCQQWFPRDK